jgi:hypothetical protein
MKYIKNISSVPRRFYGETTVLDFPASFKGEVEGAIADELVKGGAFEKMSEREIKEFEKEKKKEIEKTKKKKKVK